MINFAARKNKKQGRVSPTNLICHGAILIRHFLGKKELQLQQDVK
jgi:hypothetical protein